MIVYLFTFPLLFVLEKSELPPLKAESAILWWRFVDKNTNWGYFLVFGKLSIGFLSCRYITSRSRSRCASLF